MADDSVAGQRVTTFRTPRRRVGVTGIGLVTPLGPDAGSTWASLLRGDIGVRPISRFDASGFPVRIAATVQDLLTLDASDDGAAALHIAHRFGLAATREALSSANLRPTPDTAERWGCVLGSGAFGLHHEQLCALPRQWAPNGRLDAGLVFADREALASYEMLRQTRAALGLWSIKRAVGALGPARTISTACASGAQAVGTAARMIRRGQADVVVAVGLDSMIDPLGLAGFCLLGALSTDNDAPQRASRPFDRSRNGFVLGEGAGAVVLEDLESAHARGARVFAEVAGEGTALSSYRVTDPHPEGRGPIEAMQAALVDAGMDPENIGYVNAHGTSTPMNDRSEANALRSVFGAKLDGTWISSTKGQTGHLICAAGAVEAAITALSLHHGRLPANINLRERDDDCALPLLRETRSEYVDAAMSTSFGFGGTNHALVLRRADVA